MSKLDKISNVLDPHFKETDITKLKEVKEDMEIIFVSGNQRFLSFSYDKELTRNEFPKGLFPFFNKGEALVNSFCDYVIFSEKEGDLYVLLIELKKGNNNVTKQLSAGKCFTEYIISTVNRVYDLNITPKIRLISIRDRHIKPKQMQKEINYDENNFHTFCSSKFWLKSYLK